MEETIFEKEIKTTEEKLYIKYQEKSGLKAGDKVKVLKKAESHKLGWKNSWVDEMNTNVKKTDVITSINNSAGIRLKSNGFEYPFFVLKKVLSNPVEVLTGNKWRKSMNDAETLAQNKKIGSDTKYQYSHNMGLLYRQKISE